MSTPELPPGFGLPTTLPSSWKEIRPVPGASWIDQAVRDSLGTEVPGTGSAAVVLVVDEEGARLAAMAKAHWKGEWTFQGYLAHEWTGDNKLGARVVWHNG